MKIFSSVDKFPKNIETAITIGTFDGLHKGHIRVFEDLINIARKKKLQSLALTFFPHPRHVIYPEDNHLYLLNTLQERINRLQKTKLDNFVIQEFNLEFSRKKSIQFIRDILVNQLNMKHMIIGHDHHFGRNREGNFDELKELAQLFSFDLYRVNAHISDEVIVSSTKIRNLLSLGKIEQANKMLGYNYCFSGTVVHGEKIARKLGFPTCNISINDTYKLIPSDGVYAVYVDYNNKKYSGMLNIGVDKSSKNKKKIEVHIFDFNKYIYNDSITINFVKRIRDEINFINNSDLANQLKMDHENCINILK